MKRFASALAIVSIFCGAALFAASPATAAKKPKVNVTLASGMAPSHIVNVTFLDFVKKIEERSNGEMTGTMFPNNQLGSDTVAIQAVQDHSLVMTWTVSSAVVSVVPEVAVFDMPFFFPSIEACNKILHDPRFLVPIEAGYKRVGLMNFGLDAQGYRWMSSNAKKVIKTMDDLKGFKIRTLENPTHVAFWRALGAAPTPLANSERYTALQQGTVDGQENVMENAFNTKMYEVQDNFYNTKHIMYIGAFVGDPVWYSQLSPEHKKIFDECMAEWREATVKQSIARETTLLKELETKYKKTVVRDMGEAEFARWQKAALPVAEDLVRKKVGNELVDLLFDVAGMKK